MQMVATNVLYNKARACAVASVFRWGSRNRIIISDSFKRLILLVRETGSVQGLRPRSRGDQEARLLGFGVKERIVARPLGQPGPYL